MTYFVEAETMHVRFASDAESEEDAKEEARQELIELLQKNEVEWLVEWEE